MHKFLKKEKQLRGDKILKEKVQRLQMEVQIVAKK